MPHLLASFIKVLDNTKLTSKEKIKIFTKEFAKEPSGSQFPQQEPGIYSGWTFLMFACQSGDLEIVKWLVEKQNANVHLSDDFGMTPLHVAVAQGQAQIVDYLLKKGANVNCKVNHYHDQSTTGPVSPGTTPMHLAVRYGRATIATLLKSAGADLQIKNGEGTPLEVAKEQLEILYSLRIGKEHPLASRLGYKNWRDYSQIPSPSVIKFIIEDVLDGKAEAKFTLPSPPIDPVKKQLILKLSKYIERIERHQDPLNVFNIDFNHGFWFFRKSRGLNRQFNYILARNMLSQLELPRTPKEISTVFANADAKRNLLINQSGFFSNPKFKHRGMNSSELKAIIEVGEGLQYNS